MENLLAYSAPCYNFFVYQQQEHEHRRNYIASGMNSDNIHNKNRWDLRLHEGEEVDRICDETIVVDLLNCSPKTARKIQRIAEVDFRRLIGSSS